MNKNCLIKNASDWGVMLLISVAIGFFITFIFDGFSIFNISWYRLRTTTLISTIIGILMWKGNQSIQVLINRKFPWDVNPAKAFRWNISISSIYNTIAVFIIYTLFSIYYSQGEFDFGKQAENIIINSTIISFISFFVWTIMFLRKFFKGFKEQVIKEEQYKRDIAVYQYEMLKNQVNPHFLFNSLNVLTSLVETDPDAATKFIRKLAEVYRYVLDIKDKELVPLSEELRLAEAYVYMQKNRFGDNLIVNNSVNPDSKQIVPLALQMLIENAVKHNVVSSDKPLTIDIYENGGYLVCENNLQKKSTLPDSNTIGLNNIRERYVFLTHTPMEFGEKDGKFVVKLPLV
ncbi:sensor histidine kinase [Acetobacteroides hydrogenigenes]|uniref:Histidine kinase n=1 Tax=Acetobacteroides hydrogenigenes TaxID=979970 RepID=A0A4R2ESG6_9BACT|nr:histidine kinase [Acetobacteroides hydrogenigenes]TCN70566.1 histidine kinase [Acetobacteroides hydrogenigenes]